MALRLLRDRYGVSPVKFLQESQIPDFAVLHPGYNRKAESYGEVRI
jgi:hypothetical protein